MTKNLFKCLMILLLLSSTKIFSQDIPLPCTSDEQSQIMMLKSPSQKLEHEKFDIFTLDFIKKLQKNAKIGQAANAPTYIIPVVFHVMGTSFNGKTVTLQLIQTAIEKLNDDFNGLNDDYNTIYAPFLPIRSNLNIQFKLAQLNPNGKCTTGVEFYPTQSGFGNYSDLAHDQVKKIAWDNYKYMNIYIQNDLYGNGVLNNSGVCWYPDTYMSNNNVARCVYNGAYLFGNTNKEFASVLTHEFGHFLNLIHTFQDGCSNALAGDQVSDTPPEDQVVINNNATCNPRLNCFNNYVNNENYMGYNDCNKMFTQGQVARMTAGLNHPSRITLWQPQNLIETGVATAAPNCSTISTSNINMYEALTNSGSFLTSDTIAISEANFSISTGSLPTSQYAAQNLPAGLSVSIRAINNKQLEVKLNGNATAHAAANNTRIRIQLLTGAVENGTSQLAMDYVYINLKYYDPFAIYNIPLNVTVSPTSKWYGLVIDSRANSDETAICGFWINNLNDLKLETYTKPAICEGTTKNITLLGKSELIDGSRNWIPTVTDELHTVWSPSYTTWAGKTGYVGFQYMQYGMPCYGYFQISVAADGKSYSLLNYAFNTQPYAPITTPAASLANPSNSFVETLTNNGSFTTSNTISITGKTFAVSASNWVQNTHYSIQGLPAGLTATLKAVNANQVEIKLSGNAATHAKTNNTSFSIQLLNAAVVNGVSGLEISKLNFNLKYFDPFATYKIPLNVTMSPTSKWYGLVIDSRANSDETAIGGFWINNLNDLKLETYTKPAICEGTTKNLTLLDKGELIDGSRNWIPSATGYLHTVWSPSYTTWAGKTGYVGFQYMQYGMPCYGYFQISVAADGKSYSVLDYGFNNQPYAPITTPGASLANSSNSFVETLTNNGSFTTTNTISITGKTFVVSASNWVQNTHYSIQGLPAGLTATLKAVNANQVEIKLSGNAAAHAKTNNTSFSIQLLNAAVVNGVSGLEISKLNFNLKYFGSFAIYNIPLNVTVSPTSKWYSLAIDSRANSDETAIGGFWINNLNDLKLETYTKPAICEGTTKNLTLLSKGELIDGSRNWIPATGDLHTVWSPSYTTWAGKTGYVGFQYMQYGMPCYGYFQISVAADGKSYSVLDYGFNNQPYAPITTPGASLANSSNSFVETLTNNGSFTTTNTISITGKTFVVSASNWVQNTHYSIQGLPAGLTATLKAVNANQVEIKLSGNAAAHAKTNNTSFSIQLLNAAVVNGVSGLEISKLNFNLKYFGSFAIYNIPLNVTVSPTSKWYSLAIDSRANSDETAIGGFWINSLNDLKLETYAKPAICEGTTKNLTLLGKGELIDGSRNWIPATGDLHTVWSPSYTTWAGKTGYVGFQYMQYGMPCYGYFQISVAADGKSYSVLDYAFNNQPYAPITTPGASLANSSNSFEEALIAGPVGTITSVEQDNTESMAISPHPCNGTINISYTSVSSGLVTIGIHSLDGRLVFTKTNLSNIGNNSYTINASNLNNGNYIATIHSDRGLLSKLIIIHH